MSVFTHPLSAAVYFVWSILFVLRKGHMLCLPVTYFLIPSALSLLTLNLSLNVPTGFRYYLAVFMSWWL